MSKGIDSKNKSNESYNFSLLKNFIFTIITIVLFLSGVVVYGMILNLRDVPLKEATINSGLDSLKNVNIIIDRKSFSLNLYSDKVLVKKYRASFGRNLSDKKKSADDGATPVGEYVICEIIPNHLYHKFFKLNYPNEFDAVESLRNRQISQKDFDIIIDKLEKGECSYEKTALGGNIGIHGIGRFDFFLSNLPFVFNWTNGSIAVSDKHIDELYSVIREGTKVVIR